MSADVKELETRIRDFVCAELGYEPHEIGVDTLLFSTGMVDSFTFVGMIALLETELGRRFEPRSITVENFDSIARITAFLREVAA